MGHCQHVVLLMTSKEDTEKVASSYHDLVLSSLLPTVKKWSLFVWNLKLHCLFNILDFFNANLGIHIWSVSSFVFMSHRFISPQVVANHIFGEIIVITNHHPTINVSVNNCRWVVEIFSNHFLFISAWFLFTHRCESYFWDFHFN